MSSINWLHLSDFHFRSLQGTEILNFNHNIVIEALLDDIKNYQKEHQLTINFIVVTGDLAYSGIKDEYKHAEKFFDNLLQILNLKKSELFIVPGNHDIDKNKINPCLYNVLDDRDKINEFLMNKDAKNLCFNKFDGYKDFIGRYFSHGLKFDYDNHYFWTKKFSINSIKIGLLGLNSTWNSSGGNDKNQLLIGEKQIRDALREIQIGKVDICIAAFHHPLNWLREDDAKNVKKYLADNCQFILHGHLHEADLGYEGNPDTSIVIIPAGATYVKRQYTNSYNIVSLSHYKKLATIHLRQYSDNLRKWKAGTDIFQNAPNGICTIKYDYRLDPQPEAGDNNNHEITGNKPTKEPISMDYNINNTTEEEENIKMDSLQNEINNTPGGGVIDHFQKWKWEFFEKLCINKPITIGPKNGQISVVGHSPTVSIKSNNVTLENINIECNDHHGICLFVSGGCNPTFKDVFLKGRVKGLKGEDGDWDIPMTFDLKIRSDRKTTNQLCISIPVPARIYPSKIDVVSCSPEKLKPGRNKIDIEIKEISKGSILYGDLIIETLQYKLKRRIALMGTTYGNSDPIVDVPILKIVIQFLKKILKWIKRSDPSKLLPMIVALGIIFSVVIGYMWNQTLILNQAYNYIIKKCNSNSIEKAGCSRAIKVLVDNKNEDRAKDGLKEVIDMYIKGGDKFKDNKAYLDACDYYEKALNYAKLIEDNYYIEEVKYKKEELEKEVKKKKKKLETCK